MISNGAISQVTCASLIGKYGKDVQRFAIALLENGLAHLVASDAHHLEKRPFYWKQCERMLEKTFEDWLIDEIYENNEAVLLNQLVTINPPSPVEKIGKDSGYNIFCQGEGKRVNWHSLFSMLTLTLLNYGKLYGK